MEVRISKIIRTGDFFLFKGFFSSSSIPINITDYNQLDNWDRAILWVKNSIKQPLCLNSGLGEYSDKYCFDIYSDPIIEIQNCAYSSLLISPGRIYYKSGWIENDDLRHLHRRKAQKIVRIFEKDLNVISRPFKVTPEIKEWVHRGYELELGQGGRRINSQNIESA